MLDPLFVLIVFLIGLHLGAKHTSETDAKARKDAVKTYRKGYYGGQVSGANMLNAFSQGQQSVLDDGYDDYDGSTPPDDKGTIH